LIDEYEGRISTPVPRILEKYRDEISEALKISISDQSIFVYEMLRYCLGWVDKTGEPVKGVPGKALRPSLCLFACESVGGRVTNAMPTAVSLELIHNFSLIHDEIQDFDEVRHHRPTLWSIWGAPKALVAGDVLRMIADRSLEAYGDIDVGTTLRQVALLTEACLDMIEGQYMDISFEGKSSVTLYQYMNMIARKTGALIRSSIHLGSIIGSSDDEVARMFRRSGQSLGYVFQIRDDILGTWGKEYLTGKPVGSDIRRKKNSLPIVYAMSESQGVAKKALKEVFSKNELEDRDVELVLEIMEDVRSMEYSQGLAEEFCDKALDTLREARLSRDAMDDFGELVHFLANREF